MAESSLNAAKDTMIRRHLRQRGITDPRVLSAMARVPRERFLPQELRGDAYADRALPIDCAQTISQPYIVGLMSEALKLSGGEKVLEVGTGSGYQTAILAELARQVVTIERHARLSVKAGDLLDALGYQNVRYVFGDGMLGWPEESPYDRIAVTAAAAEFPTALFEQLVEGGILVVPIGGADYQTLEAIRKVEGRPKSVALSPCRFVPLLSGKGRPE